MPLFDVEYPLPGATLGPNSHAGGEYDLNAERVKKTGTNEFKIKCEVKDAVNDSLVYSTVWTGALGVLSAHDFWDIGLALSGAHNNCKLVAQLWEVTQNTTYQIQQHGGDRVVTGLNVNAAQGGTVAITED